MSDAVLTNDQALKLLLELSINEGFRARYEEKPAAALVELGIPYSTVVNLPASCLAPVKLQSAKVFKAARKEFERNAADVCLSMIRPHLLLGGAKK